MGWTDSGVWRIYATCVRVWACLGQVWVRFGLSLAASRRLPPGDSPPGRVCGDDFRQVGGEFGRWQPVCLPVVGVDTGGTGSWSTRQGQLDRCGPGSWRVAAAVCRPAGLLSGVHGVVVGPREPFCARVARRLGGRHGQLQPRPGGCRASRRWRFFRIPSTALRLDARRIVVVSGTVELSPVGAHGPGSLRAVAPRGLTCREGVNPARQADGLRLLAPVRRVFGAGVDRPERRFEALQRRRQRSLPCIRQHRAVPAGRKLQ